MRNRLASRVRVRRDRHPPSPTYLPLTICRGFAGIAFLCFGELFWMHLNRIGLEGEGKLLGSIALVLGSMMAIGALCGAAGTMVRVRVNTSECLVRLYNCTASTCRYNRQTSCIQRGVKQHISVTRRCWHCFCCS